MLVCIPALLLNKKNKKKQNKESRLTGDDFVANSPQDSVFRILC
jgi:hypothetical protein